jgi:2-iminobutanoate/2-iminopropanoate deaminase
MNYFLFLKNNNNINNLFYKKIHLYNLKNMSTRTIISTENAPKAIGPYSQAVKASGSFVFISGQLGLDPKTGDFVSTDIEGQTEQVLKNMGEILKASGSSYDKVVKTTILLKDIKDFPKVNEIYGKYFPSNSPARATYAVSALPKGGLVEIEAVAISNE